MKIKQNLVYREVIGEHILVPTGPVSEDQNGLFVLSEWGAFIWRRLEQGNTRDEILEAILAEYEVDTETASRDLDEFLMRLEQFGVIE
jgi:hypothetical protein